MLPETEEQVDQPRTKKTRELAQKIGTIKALKHGAFYDRILPDEDLEQFESQHQELIEEWQPNGRSEEEAVQDLALCYWQKRRVAEWYRDEEDYLSTHAEFQELDSLDLQFCLIDRAKRLEYAQGLIRSLPEPYLRIMLPELAKAQTGSEQEELQRLKGRLKELITLRSLVVDTAMDTQEFKAETALLLRDLLEKRIAIEERIDSRIDKIIRRLAQMKTLKQVIVIKTGSREIEDHRDAMAIKKG